MSSGDTAVRALRGLAYGVTIGSRALGGEGKRYGGWIGQAIGLVADVVESGLDGPRARWAKRLEELRARAADDADPLGDEYLEDLEG